MLEALNDFLVGMLWIAIDDHERIAILHDGEPCRYVAIGPDGVTHGRIIVDGDTVRIPRHYRLLVEPIDRVIQRPLCVMRATWAVQ